MPLRTSAAVVGQTWRGGSRQANLARVLSGVAIRALDPDDGRRVGELQGRAGTSDVVDAHLGLMAESGQRILTSDPDDVAHLLSVRGIDAIIIEV
jgi:hypothetical protein